MGGSEWELYCRLKEVIANRHESYSDRPNTLDCFLAGCLANGAKALTVSGSHQSVKRTLTRSLAYVSGPRMALNLRGLKRDIINLRGLKRDVKNCVTRLAVSGAGYCALEKSFESLFTPRAVSESSLSVPPDALKERLDT